MTKIDWPEKLKEITRNPGLLDRMGSADLKRAAKMLSTVVLSLGQRSAHAELNLDRVTARCMELTGFMPPMWSYLHSEEATRVHEFDAFSVVLDDASWVVCGREPGTNSLHPIYEYDFKDFEGQLAESYARQMASHLRQTFTPRPTEIKDV